MPTITVQGQTLYYARQKGNTDTVLVLVHGAGGSHVDWPIALRRWPATAVYALDLPGHGRSPLPACTTVGDYATTVLGFIEALDLPNVVLVGHSMGGAIVQTAALSHSPRLKGLVLLGTGAKLRVAESILQGLQTDFAATTASIVRAYWGTAVPDEIIALSQTRLAQNDPHVLLGDFRACHAFESTAHLAEIHLPTLVVSSDADQLTPAKHGRYLADHIPNGRFVLLNGAGHMLHLEQPHAVAEALDLFLKEISKWQP